VFLFYEGKLSQPPQGVKGWVGRAIMMMVSLDKILAPAGGFFVRWRHYWIRGVAP